MDDQGVAETSNPYTASSIDRHLLGQCCAAVMEALDGEGFAKPSASKLGAVIAEVYLICQRDGRQPTDELVASFMRVLLA